MHDAVGLAQAIRERFAEFGGVELSLPKREPMREPPAFDTSEYDETNHDAP